MSSFDSPETILQKMTEPKEIPSPQLRSAEEIFADIRTLAHSDGALHEISALIYRDWLVKVDMREAKITDDAGYRWNPARLNKNELMLLLGLMVQADHTRTYDVLPSTRNFAETADRLLREFHDYVNQQALPAMDAQTVEDTQNFVGLLAREAIYYGAEGFYIHQFKRYARLRYKEDATWLLQNVGLSMRPMLEMAQYLVDNVNRQMTVTGHLQEQGQIFTKGDLSSSLLVSKASLREKFGSTADIFLTQFSTYGSCANSDFTHAFALNQVALAPLIDLGDYVYVGNQYRLYEAIYEGPFYWMNKDKAYIDIAAEHRGAFLEKTTAFILRSIFGTENVYENVIIDNGTKDTPGEIDVLVIYGEFVLVVQAKSKRITQVARAGDTVALKNDFEGAIAHPYRQALTCIDLIKAGAKCVSKSGITISTPSVKRISPVVVLSDSFPASTLLSRPLLQCDETLAPVIWDLGVLDCVAKLLPSPIEMIYYLKCRSEAFSTVLSDSEYNFLGYHLKSKLILPHDADALFLERDFATEIDDFMISIDVGLDPDRPRGVLERMNISPITEILAEIKNGDPRLSSVVIDLYDFSSVVLEDMSKTILELRDEISSSEKAIKAFSLRTATGGITYAVSKRIDESSRDAAAAIGAKHKYDSQSDRWYVILDSVQTTNPIDGLLPLVWPWVESEEEAARSKEVGHFFKSTSQAVAPGDWTLKPLSTGKC